MNQVSLGSYLVNLGIFTSFGASWGQIFAIVLKLETAMPNLYRIILLMNSPTDFGELMELSKARLANSRKLNLDAIRFVKPGCFSIDEVAIRIHLGAGSD